MAVARDRHRLHRKVTMESTRQGMLSPYRVLDLADEKGLLCGKILSDLGADVVKIERRDGDPARDIGPFFHDDPHPEKSLFWFAFNTNKRGITLNIEAPDGKQIFKKLVNTSDFIIESFPPGYMSSLGLGYNVLREVNPRIIMVSISPFGQSGPYRDLKTCDMVSWALGGQMYLWGSADRSPVRISHHSHAYMHAGSQAAVGAMLALHARHISGRGQQVDVSIHECVSYLSLKNTIGWPMINMIPERGTPARHPGGMWPCKDGWVVFNFGTGPLASRSHEALVKWMDEEGMANDFLRGFDWTTYDGLAAPESVVKRLEEPTARFFLSHTKMEILRGAVSHRVLIYPAATTEDIAASEQLAERGFWAQLEHPELDVIIRYPGAFLPVSNVSRGLCHRAPLIGEHNTEVYGGELGFSASELSKLKQAGVI